MKILHQGKTLISPVLAPLLSIFILMLGHGPYNTFFGLELQEKHVPYGQQGIIHSIYFLGLLLGPFKVEKLVSSIGHIRVFTIFCCLYAISVSLQAISSSFLPWTFSRFLSGYAIAGVYVIIESWLLLTGGKEDRGKTLSLYMVALYGGVSIGQLLLKYYIPLGLEPYFYTIIFICLAAIPVAITLKSAPSPHLSVSVDAKALWQEAFLGSIGVLVSGMVLSNIYGLFPVYLSDKKVDVGIAMALTIMAGGIIQYPIGKLSDRIQRSKVIYTISLCIFLSCLIPEMPFSNNLWILLLFCLLIGGSSFTLYPVAMAQVCDRYQEESLVKVTGYLMIIYSIGAVIGPALTGQLMKYFGENGLLYSFQLYSGILLFVGFLHSRYRKPVRDEDKIEFVQSPWTTAVALQMNDQVEDLSNPSPAPSDEYNE